MTFNAGTVNTFAGLPVNCQITTDDFRLDAMNGGHVLVISTRVLSDDNATAAVAGRNAGTDPQTFVGYGQPATISKHIDTRADGFMHAVDVRLTANFTWAQGVGLRFTVKGRR
jgi:hypothetical protein